MSSGLSTSLQRNASNIRPAKKAAAAPEVVTAHRADIEGLRGIAVLSLLAVHLFPNWNQAGGLFGMDVFFVVSGYLVSDALFRAHAAGSYSLRPFYAARLRRIVPSLILVLLSCLVFSWLFTSASITLLTGAHVAAAAFFITNFAIWSGAWFPVLPLGQSPLHHLWALALGAQFCIVWPIVLNYLLKRRSTTVVVVSGAVLISFGLNVTFVASEPIATLLLPATRFWELLAGALLACLGRGCAPAAISHVATKLGSPAEAGRLARECLAWSGVAFLTAAVLLIDSTDHFPGWWALLPTAGTLALLAAGPEASVNRRFLARPVLRFYGAISYPLYLWHWPLLTFPALMGVPLSNEVRVIILIASVVLAALTHELVEKSASLSLGGSRMAVALVFALACMGLIGYVVKESGGLLNTFPENTQQGGYLANRR